MDDLLTLMRSGLWRLNYQLSPEGKTRFFNEFLPLLNDTKLQVLGSAVDQNSWYLVYIGTTVAGRGKGHARRVIEYVTRKADKEGILCYLESSHAVNRIIYGKMGFELRKNIYLQRAREHVELDIMVRKPVAGVRKG
jgi:predicted acetyltransferase